MVRSEIRSPEEREVLAIAADLLNRYRVKLQELCGIMGVRTEEIQDQINELDRVAEALEQLSWGKKGPRKRKWPTGGSTEHQERT